MVAVQLPADAAIRGHAYQDLPTAPPRVREEAFRWFLLFFFLILTYNSHKASKLTLIKSPKIDKYLIPPTFTFALYQEYFKDEPFPIEIEFFRSLKPTSISHVDEYLALRNIILVSRRPNLNTLLDKIPVRFQPKFISLFKFFVMNGIIDIDVLEKKSKKILSFYPPPKKSVPETRFFFTH